MSELNFSNEPLPNAQQYYEDWAEAQEFAPPPPAGIYRFYLSQIREEKEYEISNGKRYSCTVDMRINGGAYDERSVNFQRFSNGEFERPRGSGKFTSQLLDLVKAAGQQNPLSNAQYSQLVHMLVDRGPGVTFPAQIDWRGFCTKCYEKKLVELTGAANVQMAKDVASGDQRTDAADFATKAKNHRGFPEDGNGNRKDTLLCTDCGNEVRAQVRVQRFLAPGE